MIVNGYRSIPGYSIRPMVKLDDNPWIECSNEASDWLYHQGTLIEYFMEGARFKVDITEETLAFFKTHWLHQETVIKPIQIKFGSDNVDINWSKSC